MPSLSDIAQNLKKKKLTESEAVPIELDNELANLEQDIRPEEDVFKRLASKDDDAADLSYLERAALLQKDAPEEKESPEDLDNQAKLYTALAGILPSLGGYLAGGYKGGEIGGKVGAETASKVGEAYQASEAAQARAQEKAEERGIKEKYLEKSLQQQKASEEYRNKMLGISEKQLELAQRKQSESVELEKEKMKQEKVKPLASEQAQRLADHDFSLNSLVELKKKIVENQSLMGPVSGRITGSNVYNVKAQELQAMTKAAAQNIGKSLEGGKLTDQDIIRYQKMLPDITDPPDVAIAKLDAAAKLIESRQKSDVETFGKAGGNVKKFKESEPESGAGFQGESVEQNGHVYHWNPESKRYE